LVIYKSGVGSVSLHEALFLIPFFHGVADGGGIEVAIGCMTGGLAERHGSPWKYYHAKDAMYF
jgi:hypothetical protein